MPVTRKLLRTVTASLAVLPNAAFALGLGPIEVESSLDQPLDARIPIVSLRPGEIEGLSAGLASRELFERMGFERPVMLSKLTFSVENRGGDRPYIRVSSSGPIREPLLDLLVEVRWSSGRLLRDYAVLLDPPVTVRRPRPRNAIAPYVPGGNTASPVRAATAVRPKPNPNLNPLPAGIFQGSEYGPVVAGDTLWTIASRTRPDRTVSVQQMMLALLRSNPDAFFQPNVNSLNAGAVLRIPEREEIASLTKDEALREVRQQYAGFGNDAERSVAGMEFPLPAAGEIAVKLVKPGASMALADETQAPGPLGVEGGTADSGSDEGDRRPALIRVENGGISLQLAGMDELSSRIPTLVAVDDAALAVDAVSQAVGEKIATSGSESLTETGDSDPAPLIDSGFLQKDTVAEASAAKYASQANRSSATDQPAPVYDEPAMLAEEAVDIESTVVPEFPVESETPGVSGVEEDTETPATETMLPSVTPETGTEDLRTEEPGQANVDGGSGVAPLAIEEPVLDSADLVAAPTWLTAILGILNDPRSLAIAGGSVLLFLLMLLLLVRRALSRGDGGSSNPKAELPERLAAGAAAPPTRVAPAMAAVPPPAPHEIAASGLAQPEPVADPAAKADVFLAMGDHAEAIELLEAALAADSGRSDLAFKLLEAHHAQGSKEGYLGALETHRVGLEEGKLWEQVLAMGSELAPEHPMFVVAQEGGDQVWLQPTQAEPEASSEATRLEPAQTNTEASAQAAESEPVQAQQKVPSMATAASDVLEFVVPDREPKPESKPAKETNLDLEDGLEFDLDQFAVDERPKAEPAENEVEAADDVGLALEEEFRKLEGEDTDQPGVETDELLASDETLSLNLGDQDQAPAMTADAAAAEVLDFPGNEEGFLSTDEAPPEEDDSFVDTKLDLATAYLEMGDDVGARTLYEEVVEEGNDLQRSQAKEALERIGYG